MIVLKDVLNHPRVIEHEDRLRPKVEPHRVAMDPRGIDEEPKRVLSEERQNADERIAGWPRNPIQPGAGELRNIDR